MSPCFQFTRGALFAAAACVSLLAAPQIAAAGPAAAQPEEQGSSPGGYNVQDRSYSEPCDPSERSACQPNQPIPYASQQLPNLPVPYADQRGGGDGGPPPRPPPPPPAPTTYIPSDQGRQAASNNVYGARATQNARCQMVEDRVLFPDGTSEISSVQACHDRGGHWYVAD